MTHVVVIGATGDVGRGVVGAALDRGWQVTAVGRGARSLDALAAEAGDDRLRTLTGSIATEADARETAKGIDFAAVSALVVATSAPWEPKPLLELSYDAIASHFAAYLQAHVAAATTFLPLLRPGSVHLAIGGGMADIPARGLVGVSMAQAAQRIMYRTLAKEAKDSGVAVRELMVISMVNGHSNRAQADAGWLTDAQIGARACEIIEKPGESAGPILTIGPGDK